MRDHQFPGRSVVMSTHGMISTSQPMATQVGLEVLKSGGNAMDAAIAASATLCVTEPQSTGIGGDCFLLYHEARTGKLHGLNGSGRAPAKATPEEYRRRGHSSVPERGLLSVTVPGAIAGWETAIQRFGTRTLGELLQPAIVLAEEGYAVTPVVAWAWNRQVALLSKTESSARVFISSGRTTPAGSRHRQPDLARSLRLIAKQGKKAFYEGPIAKGIADYMRANGGLIEEADLAAHQSEWVEPISTDYRGLRMCEIPPNGQGITALIALNILEHTRLGELEHLSVDYVHTFTEAFKLALSERDRWVADMHYADVPVAALLNKDYARSQFGRIDAGRALTHPVQTGLNGGAPHRDTIYLTVVDKDHNCCSFINSLYHNFGSGVIAGETGVMLQNRGAGFVIEEGHPNCIAPGKRPMHTIIPAMVYRGNEPILSFGVMGGHYQAMGHSYVLSNWIDFGMDLQESLDAPRFLPQHGVLTVERGIPEPLREGLRHRGHTVAEADSPLGGGQMIYIDAEAGVLQAASDPRKDGCAMGY
jgi:gamma-glutamyltranspeptidase / glutathione hydrolase